MPLRSEGLITDPVMPICVFCKHLLDEGESMKCRAFPSGIPNLIIESVQDHRFRVEGDNGIIFDPTGDEGIELAAEYFGAVPSENTIG